MNIAMRKLALLEKDLIAKEENSRITGYTTSPADAEFKEKITKLMDQIRYI